MVPISNDLTDRVYLAANDGSLICLHDRDYAKPVPSKHDEEPAPAKAKKGDKTKAMVQDKPKPKPKFKLKTASPARKSRTSPGPNTIRR